MKCEKDYSSWKLIVFLNCHEWTDRACSLYARCSLNTADQDRQPAAGNKRQKCLTGRVMWRSGRKRQRYNLRSRKQPLAQRFVPSVTTNQKPAAREVQQNIRRDLWIVRARFQEISGNLRGLCRRAGRPVNGRQQGVNWMEGAKTTHEANTWTVYWLLKPLVVSIHLTQTKTSDRADRTCY